MRNIHRKTDQSKAILIDAHQKMTPRWVASRRTLAHLRQAKDAARIHGTSLAYQLSTQPEGEIPCS